MIAIWIIGASLLGSVGSVLLSGGVLLFPTGMRRVLIPALVSYAAGTLLGGAFLGLLPHALGEQPSSGILLVVLIGILGFFILEKVVLWHRCHHDHKCEFHKTTGPLILIGDAIHNLIDGAVITSAFLTSIPLGIATALAVIAHEVPQEVGDFAILLDSGYSRGRALFLNTLVSLTTLGGAIAAFFILGGVQEVLPYAMALAAASFIYIGLADLVPDLHHYQGLQHALRQVVLFVAGAATIYFLASHAH